MGYHLLRELPQSGALGRNTKELTVETVSSAILVDLSWVAYEMDILLRVGLFRDEHDQDATHIRSSNLFFRSM